MLLGIVIATPMERLRQFCLSASPSSTLRFKDLVPVLYQEGRYQGDPVTLGVGGFGRVELVGVSLCLASWSVDNICYQPWKRKTGAGCRDFR